MKALILAVLFSVQVFGYNSGGAPSSIPKSAPVIATSASVIPLAFGTALLGQASQSMVLTGLADYGYSHVQIINQTSTSLSWVTASDRIAPSSSSSAKMYVIANGLATFDNVNVLNNLFLQSEGSSTVSSGYVDINVW